MCFQKKAPHLRGFRFSPRSALLVPVWVPLLIAVLLIPLVRLLRLLTGFLLWILTALLSRLVALLILLALILVLIHEASPFVETVNEAAGLLFRINR